MTDNTTEQCNATGMGKQYRGVSCLSSGSVPEADECKLPRPSRDRSCRCISSQVGTPAIKSQVQGVKLRPDKVCRVQRSVVLD